MRKTLSVFLAIVMCLRAGSVGWTAFAAQVRRAEKTTLIVEFDGDAGQGGVAAQSEATRRTLHAMQEAAHGAEPVYTYSRVLNAVAIETAAGDADTIAQLDGVQAVYDVGGVKPAVEAPPKDSMISSGDMIGVDALHEQGIDGTGTAIAVIDGGLQWNHPAMTLSDPASAKYSKEDIAAVLRDNKMNCAGVSAGDVYKSAKVPFAFDYCEGDTTVDDYTHSDPDHGTHVSGIAAGNSVKLRGVAPEAQVLMFKVDLYDVETFLPNLLAAIDDAAKFDISSMNMSVGIDFESRTNPAHAILSKAITNARNAGITVCTAAGNSGVSSDNVLRPDNGTNGIPNSFADAMSVASVDNVNLSEPVAYMIQSLTYAGGKQAEVLGYTSLGFPEAGEYIPITDKGPVAPLDGKVALVYDQRANAKRYLQNAGIRGLIIAESALWSIYNIRDGFMEGFEIIMISDIDAYRLYHSADKHYALTYDHYYAEPADILRASNFTSFGVSEDLKMTVDLAAPGGIIYSSVTGGQYDIYDGTSMASPHAAGCAALLDQYFTKAYPDATGTEKSDLKETILCSTADPVMGEKAPLSPRAVGAGLINLREATAAKAVLTGKDGRTALNLGDGIDDTFTLSFTMQNVSRESVRYDTLQLDVITDDCVSQKLFDDRTGTYTTYTRVTGQSVPLSFTISKSDMPRSITLQPGESRTVTLTVQLDKEQLKENAAVFENGFYVEGYAYLTDSFTGNTPLNIPFMGFRGDWERVPAISYGEMYESYWGMLYYMGIGYSVQRNLRSLEFVLEDAEGRECAVYTESYAKKGELFGKDSIVSLFDEIEVADGTYTLVVKATPDIPDAAPQILRDGLQVTIDRTVPKILGVQINRDRHDTVVTITCASDDVDYFELTGATLLDRNYVDLIPVEGADQTDAQGNYVYELHLGTSVRGRLLVKAVDRTGLEDSWGRATLLLRIYLFLRDLPLLLLQRINNWIYEL